MSIFDVADITLIKDEMDENSISYWEAVAIICYGYEYQESFLRFDMEVYKESEPVIEWKTGEDIFKKKIIKNILENILENNDIIRYESTIEEIILCPVCGNLTDGSWSRELEPGFIFRNDIKDILQNLNNYTFISVCKMENLEGKSYYFVKTKNSKVKTSEEPCDSCKFFYDEEGNYKEGGVDNLFDDYVWSHGLATGYSGHCDAEEITDRLVDLDLHHEWQICCSHKTQKIGAIGVYIMGHAQYVSNIDLSSHMDKQGNRVFNPSGFRAVNGLITSPEEIDLSDWDHNEVILTKHRIVGVWIKEWALKDPKMQKLWDYLVPIAKDNGWIVHVCKARRE